MYVSEVDKLMLEWNREKNIDISPDQISVYSEKKVWWRCSTCGNSWQATVKHRYLRTGCPYCSHHKVMPGYNDLASQYPDIATEWDNGKNEPLKPTEVSSYSNKKVWWICHKGHEYEATVNHRVSERTGCPYCSNSKVLEGYNDLASQFPKIALEWDYEKNGNLKPTEVIAGSGKKMWWICSNCGHSWKAQLYERTKFGTGCPVCGRKKQVKAFKENLIKEKGSIAELPIAKEWNFARNGDLKPSDFTAGSNKKVWWICSKGHEWQATIVGRFKPMGCPYCSNRRVLSGYNDIGTLYPELLEEWDWEKNGDLKPEDIVIGSTKKVWWKCKTCGYEWQTATKYRTRNHSGCPECAKLLRGKEKHETELALNGSLEDSELAQEWNYEKNGALKPADFTKQANKKVWWKCKTCGYEWQAKINNRYNGRGCPLCSNKVVVAGVNDLATTNPELAAEWNYERNGELKPTTVTAGAGKKVWWKCPKGHEYEATILHRSDGTNCPICNSGRQTSFAEQALFYYIKQLFPDAMNRCMDIIGNRMELDIYIPSRKLAIEYDGLFWHKENRITRDKKKYELCKQKGIKLIRVREQLPKKGIVIADEVYSTKGLDKNKNLDKIIQLVLSRLDTMSSTFERKDLFDFSIPISVDLQRDNFKIREYMAELKKDSLADLYPDIVEEWNQDKNGDLLPNMFKPGSSVKIWWKCRTCGYEWQSTIDRRVKSNGCPECYKQYAKLHPTSAKKIYQYDLEGNFIREWNSIAEAERELKINHANISSCAKHLRSKAGGFSWEFSKVEKKEPVEFNLFSS